MLALFGALKCLHNPGRVYPRNFKLGMEVVFNNRSNKIMLNKQWFAMRYLVT